MEYIFKNYIKIGFLPISSVKGVFLELLMKQKCNKKVVCCAAGKAVGGWVE